MKIKAILSLIVFMGVLSSIQSQLQPPETVVLEDYKCINSGKVLKGSIQSNDFSDYNLTDAQSQPINGSCPAGWTLLEPGVIVSNNQIISSKGYCLEKGFLVDGKAVSIGPLVDTSNNFTNGKPCSSSVAEGLVLMPETTVTIVDENTPLSDVYIVQDDPLITSLKNFSTITIEDIVCIDSVSTAQVNLGVLNDGSLTTFDQNSCLVNAFVRVGRVLVESENVIVKNNETLSSGSVCSFKPIVVPTGVVLAPGVVVIIPEKTLNSTTKPYYTTKYYEDRGYYKPYEKYQQAYQEYEDNYKKRNRNMRKSRLFAEEIAEKISSKLQRKMRGRQDWYDY